MKFFKQKVLEVFNFGSSIQNWIEIFYNDIRSSVLVNGFGSDFFKLSRGCRQGDPISPYIFVLCAEILTIMLRNNPNIQGIKIGDVEYLTSQFADDTTLILDGTEKSLQNALQTLKTYSEFSGLKINTSKTQVMWIGSKRHEKEILCRNWKLDWSQTTFKILGITFTHNLAEMVERNYKDKLKSIKIEMNKWLTRDLTPLGRNTVLKSLLLPKLNHLFSSLPNPTDNIINELDNLCYKFLWRKKPDKIKRCVLSSNLDEGGIRAPSVRNIIKSQKISWVRRLYNSEENTRTNTFHFQVSTHISNIVQKSAEYIKRNVITAKTNAFWKEVLMAWGDFITAKGNHTKTVSDILSQPLWHNANVKIDGKTIYIKRLDMGGIKYIMIFSMMQESFWTLIPLEKYII